MTSGRMLTVYDPTAEPRGVKTELAPRLATLAGRRAGILDNGKANAGLLMSAIVERLRLTHGVAEVVKREKPVAGPPSPEVLADLSRCDFALVGSADWGSCTSWSIHGAILLESRGVPTVVVGTDEFVELARLESRNRGMANLPLALVPHPLGGIAETEVLAKVDAVMEAVVRALSER